MYAYPDPEKIPENGRMYSRAVTLRAYVPPIESEEAPAVEIAWSFQSSREIYTKLQALKEIMGQELKVKAFSGEMCLQAENPPYIRVRVFIDKYESAQDVLINTLYMLRPGEIEYIILENFNNIRCKVQELAELEVEV